ncbi:MAG: DNA mismatch repair endonuclease MutL [Candidatus Lokiarchaeota archaeon]|nr:DNA mismatch repair endonuclease MutL [Candidatus Lokiarchaeota archaeon]
MIRKKIQKIQNAEQIAAGEVVERPANVIKELIENSIDAGSTEIKVNIRKAGKRLIQVIDNGFGIPSEELEIALKRHTSSKIRRIEDLQKLSTLGFRGEALASIIAVSKVEIISRTSDEEIGLQLIIEGGIIKKKNKISVPVGVNIQVKDLFYNIPARQKFLKSDPTELGHITDIIQRYSLAYPNIHFIYTHNELQILNCPSENDLKTTVFHIYGKNIINQMKEIEYEEKGYLFKITGLIGHPRISRKSRDQSSIFINQRYIKSDLLFRAIKEAYEGILMINKNPFFILNLEVNPSIIDFNIHPKKLEIRFEDDIFIYNKVYNILRGFINSYFLKSEEEHILTDLNKYTEKYSKIDEKINGYSFQKELKIKEKTIQNNKKEKEELKITSKNIGEKIKDIPIIGNPCEIKSNIKKLEDQNLNYDTLQDRKDEDLRIIQLDLDDNYLKKEDSYSSDSIIRNKYIIKKNFPKIRLMSYTGQLNNKIYIVLEGKSKDNEEGLFILDQHAASERITKEFYYNMYNRTKKMVQKLISPLKIEISPTEKIFLENNLKKIEKLGFKFENFGGNTYLLREIPIIFHKTISSEIIRDIISDIAEIGRDKSFSDAKEEIINYLSCHRSIRGGDNLSLKDIRKLIEDLAACENPFHCAHGRPTLKFISFKEMDKFFRRTA